MSGRHGPDAPCERTACADEPTHKGGEHIDPRSPRYDGPQATFSALPHDARRAAYALMAAGAPVPEIVDMAREIHRLREQVAAVTVDHDRRVTAALARSASCEAHGEQITELEQRVHHFDQLAEKNDKGRVALLALPHAIQDMQDDATPTVAGLKRAARKALDAHGRAWK